MLTRSDVAHELQREIVQAGTHDVAVLLLRFRRYRQDHVLFDNNLNDAIKARLVQVLRPEDRYFEIGENRFAVVLPGIRGSNHALLGANRLVRGFVEPLTIGIRQVQVAPTIGVAVFPEHGINADTLLERAQTAFARALASSDRYALALPDLQRTEVPYEELRDAITGNQLEVYFQPLWDLDHGCVHGAESLARWKTIDHGFVSPTEFVLLAEQTGLINALTRWSLNTTFRHCASVIRAGHHLRFSVNLSPRVFHDPNIVENIVSAAAIWEIPTEQIILEVTESAVMEDAEVSAQVLHRLRDHGFGIGIDDFGIGYSTFSYLKRFPATELKIDQSFVRDVVDDPRSARLVQSMIDLGQHLDMLTVAEGVETAEVADALKNMGCAFAQGYLFGTPEPAAQFLASLES